MGENIEIWKDITFDERLTGKYQISNWGRVKSLNYRRMGKEAILKIHSNPTTAYIMTTLSFDNTQKIFYVHQLVAHEFIGERPGRLDVHHQDEDKSNNRVENLAYVSRRYNCNFSKNKNASSPYPGVYRDKSNNRNPWGVKIQINGKILHLGSFLNEVEAYRAYREREIEYEKTGK